MIEQLGYADQLVALDFQSFVIRVFQTVMPGRKFTSNWHHAAIAWHLEEIEHGLNRRLIINMPPRSLKSIMVSVAWVAWLLGRDPTLRIVCISYSAGLALDFARMCRLVMESLWYRQTFPGTRLVRRAEYDLETTRGGGRFSTSIDGTLTGRGGDIIILDDPMKQIDAYSESARRRVHEFFRGTAISRLNNRKTGSFVLVEQRLHEEDLSGVLLEEGGWKHLCLPARTSEDRVVPVDEGESYFWPAGALLDPERLSEAQLAEIERTTGHAACSANYLQAPVPATGIMVKREWLKSYSAAPNFELGDQIVQSWDTATKAGALNDYSCCVTALVRKNTVYLLDVFRAKLEFTALKRKVIELARRWQTQALLIEAAASGEQLLNSLRLEPQPGVPTPISRPATTDKVTRLAGQTPRIEAGDLLLPEGAPWLAAFLHELLGFPHARHDDQVDALAHLLGWLGQRFLDYDSPGPVICDFETGMCSDGTSLNDIDERYAHLDPWGAY